MGRKNSSFVGGSVSRLIFFFFFFKSADELLVSDLIHVFFFWKIIHVKKKKKIAPKVKMHLYKLHFVQGFCSFFRSRFCGWNLLSRIPLQLVSKKMMIAAVFRTIGTKGTAGGWSIPKVCSKGSQWGSGESSMSFCL